MKLKREHATSIKHTANNLKGLFFLLLIWGVFPVMAQTVSVTATDAAAAEVEAPAAANPGSFTVTRNPNSFAATIVNYTVAVGAGQATPGTDYTALSGTVTIPAAQTMAVINVSVLDDEIVENNETVTITLTSASGTFGVGLPNTATVTIGDTDTGTFTLEMTEAAAAEEGRVRGRYVLRLDKENGTGQPLNVPYTLGGTANNGGANSDYGLTGQATGQFTFPAGVLARALNIIPVDDVEVEDEETVILNLGQPSNTTQFAYTQIPAAQRTVTIADNDCTAGDTAPTINATPNSVCNPPTANVNLNTYVVGGAGSAPAGASLRWSLQENPTAEGDLLPNATVTANDTYYAIYWADDNSCFSPTSNVTITFNTPPSAGNETAPTVNEACNNANDDFGLTRLNLVDLIENEDAGDWAFTSGPATVNPTGGNSRVNFRNQPAGAYVYTYTTNTAVAPCTDDSISVTINVDDCDPCVAGDDAPTLDTSIPRTFCDDITTSLNDYAPNGGPNGTVLRWATDQNDPTGSFVATNRITDPLPGTYYGFYFDATNDCASPLLTLNLEQNTTPEITSSTPNQRCGPGTMVLRATANEDATIRWYSVATGGTPTNGANFTTPNLNQTASFFVEATVNGCTSSPRIEVVATIIPQPTAGAPEDTSSCNDANFGSTTLDLDDTFTVTPSAGAWAFSSGPTNVVPNAENIVDFLGTADGTYVFAYTTTGAQAPCENEVAEVTISISNCDTDDDGDGLLGGLESMLGTDPNNVDTDGDGINDNVEVGEDTANPIDGDGDGIIDALDSNILDTDEDGVVDQLDPGNTNACIPDNSNALCDTDNDGITDGQEEIDGTNPLDACDPDINNPNCDPTPIDIEVLKEADKLDAIAGDEVIFTVTVNNLSDRIARNITIGDMLETGFEINPNSLPDASVGTYDAEAGIWTIPEIPPTGSATLAITVAVLEGGPYNNVAELLESFPVDDNPANDRAEVILNIDLPEGIDLVLEKLARIVDQNDTLNTGTQNRDLSEVNPLLGDEIIFTIKVTNESNEDAVSSITVLDTISPAFINPRFIPELTPELGTYDSVTGVLRWTPLELLRNEVAQLEIRVLTDSVGTFRNTAEIDRSSPLDSEGNYDNNTDTVIINVSERTEAEFGIIFNQFSPNDDGVNDDLKINKRRTNEDGTQEEIDIFYNIKIFNRYGSLIFEGDQLTDEVIWDGNRNGKEVPDGTYFYVLNVTLQEEIEGIETNTTKKGWIQLIR